ncbi:zinc-finger homeodomain protein 6 [Cajanus cajan]|uniref:zinc-finger homeodomain protein 6 n=1 Tax=Cajanus cajan TaxID=3821 RepID=UPI0010FB13AC|nr:zinc-finger homeodomain protein 6 [Cajanus cajan]
MDMREQDKELEMPSTLGYNLPNKNSSSSKLSSPIGEKSDQQPPQSNTLIFSDPPQTSHLHHNLYTPSLPPNPLQLPQSQRPRRDPDPNPISPPIIITTPRTSLPQPHTTTTAFRYRECLKNHAASMGGHVTDGCGEFMPNGEDGTPESFKCAACDCHRNFHRKEAEGEPQYVLNYHHTYSYKNNRNIIHSPQSHLQFPIPHHHLHGVVAATPSSGPIQPVMLGLGGGPAESSSEDLNMFQTSDGGQLLSVQPPLSSSNKKRFRTKFTQQQKDRMIEFAEKLGWKIQKQDEQELHQFCSQVGVKRQAFKVWMHNSKQAMKKKQIEGGALDDFCDGFYGGNQEFLGEFNGGTCKDFEGSQFTEEGIIHASSKRRCFKL